MRQVRDVAAVLRAAENLAAAGLLAVICGVTAAQVVFRFVLRAPLAWSDELGTFSFVWFALLGAAIGFREGAHIGVDALVRVLPRSQRVWVAVGTLFLVQVFLLCLVKFGVDLLLRIGDQRSSGLQIQIFWVYLALPLSATLMLTHSVPIFWRLVAATRGADGRRG
jgi:TRAP-type C4-dicarboxylate transport system permease small subunit